MPSDKPTWHPTFVYILFLLIQPLQTEYKSIIGVTHEKDQAIKLAELNQQMNLERDIRWENGPQVEVSLVPIDFVPVGHSSTLFKSTNAKYKYTIEKAKVYNEDYFKMFEEEKTSNEG